MSGTVPYFGGTGASKGVTVRLVVVVLTLAARHLGFHVDGLIVLLLVLHLHRLLFADLTGGQFFPLGLILLVLLLARGDAPLATDLGLLSVISGFESLAVILVSTLAAVLTLSIKNLLLTCARGFRDMRQILRLLAIQILRAITRGLRLPLFLLPVVQS